MEVLEAHHLEDLDVPDATFTAPDLTTFARLDELGLEVTGQRLEPDRAVLACRVLEPDEWCRRCGCEGIPRDTVTRELAHEPLGWRPTTLAVTVRRYRCTGCPHVWRQDTTLAAEPRAKLSRRGLRWALAGIVCQHLSIARVAAGLGVAWNTANEPYGGGERATATGYAIAARSSLQACSQARQASAQTRQCSWWPACCSHSSPQDLHAWAHAWTWARVRLAS